LREYERKQPKINGLPRKDKARKSKEKVKRPQAY
jgi:hypothetical protein